MNTEKPNDIVDYFPSAPDVVNTKEAAVLLRVGLTTIRKLLGDGTLRSLLVRKRRIIPKKFLNEFVETQGNLWYHDKVQTVDNLSLYKKGAVA